MSVRSIEVLQRCLRRLCDEALPPPDAVLLNRFARAKDREAFALLIARHGPMVLGTARRLVDNSHDAEDVFQAVFLSLARLAKTVRQGRTLPAWLHKTTCRVAAKVRKDRVCCAKTPPPEPSENIAPEARLVWQEVRQALDEELQRLPERWRSPLLLCYLSGLTRDEAAKQLGWSLGTLKRRLEEGRQALRIRLARRGIASVGLALTVLTPRALQAAVGKGLLDSTISLIFSTGAVVPATISALVLSSAGTLKGLVMKSILALVAAIALGVGIHVLAGEADAPATAEGKTEEVRPAQEDKVVQRDDPLPAGSTLRFGTSRFRQGVGIVTMAVSADSKTAFVVSGSRFDGSTRAFDLASGQVRFSIANEEGEGVAVSPDGRTFVTTLNLRLNVRDSHSGKVLRTIDLPKANPRSSDAVLGFTPDGKAVATISSGKDLHLIDVESGRTIRDFSNANPESSLGPGWETVLGIAFAADGKLMASGGFNNDKGTYFARLWDVETGKELRRFVHSKQSYGIRSLAFSPDAKTLATRSHDGRLRLFDVDTGKERKTFPPDGGGRQPRTVAFAPDGKTVAAAGNSIRLYDTTTFEERLRIDRRQACGLHFTDEGKTLTAAVDGAIYRWDTASGKALTPEAGDSVVEQILVSADGSRVITRGQAGDGHIWDGVSGKHLRTLRVAYQAGLAMSPDGRFLAWPIDDESVRFTVTQDRGSIYSGSRIRLYDIVADRFVDRFAGFKGAAQDLAFTGDGKNIVTSDSRPGMVRIWNLETGNEERSFELSTDEMKKRSYFVGRTQLSPDAKTAVVTYVEDRGGRLGRGPRHIVRLWDVATGKERAPLKDGHPLDKAFSPDGRLVATNGGNSVKHYSPDGRLIGPTDGNGVCETAGGTRVAALPSVYIHAAAFSRDGRFLATAVDEGAIQLWEVATWTKRNEFKGHRDPPTALTFMPNGQLLSGSIDTTVLAWDIRPPRSAATGSLETAWIDLANRESSEAFKAEARFLAAPAETVKLFGEKIKPVDMPDAKRIQQLLADLDSAQFAVRASASRALSDLGQQAKPALEQAVKTTKSAEFLARAQKLLDRLKQITREEIRQTRAVLVLEWIDDAESKNLLRKWAGGLRGAFLTEEASAALTRLDGTGQAQR
jgi:RNA polymerase sigma factor (sigma-70 family)